MSFESTVPAGIYMLLPRIVSITLWRVKLFWDNFSGSIFTWSSFFVPPSTDITEVPFTCFNSSEISCATSLRVAPDNLSLVKLSAKIGTLSGSIAIIFGSLAPIGLSSILLFSFWFKVIFAFSKSWPI